MENNLFLKIKNSYGLIYLRVIYIFMKGLIVSSRVKIKSECGACSSIGRVIA